MHDSSAQLQIKMTLNTLLRDSLRDTLRKTTLKLTRQQIAKPPLKQWHNSTQEEEPHTPTRSPKSAAWAFANGTCVETVVDQVFQVLAHAHLTHEAVLVPIHTC